MHIVFFMQNNHAGGMDSFLSNTIDNWPFDDDIFTLVCNKNHSGLPIIKSRIKKRISILEHNLLIASELTENLFFLSYRIRRIFHPFLKIILTPIHIFFLKKIFNKINANKLIVINGAYPGGETCRLANIAWYQIGREKSIHNIRNFAIKPHFIFEWYENYLDKLLIKSTKKFIGVSKCCAESLRNRKYFKNLKNIIHIYNGVKVDDLNDEINHEFNLKKNLNIKNDQICLMLGTYEKRKGHDFLFKAFDKVYEENQNVSLIVCGDSKTEDRKYVESLRLKSKSRNKIYLLNYINNGSLLIKQADILLIASQEWESFGWTAIESMARKIPVVSTNSGGLKEVIGKNGVSGFCHNINEIDEYSSSIIKLLNSQNLREKISQNAYNRVTSLFSQKKMINDYFDSL